MPDSKVALFFKGVVMGTVDIVPGVSGSTVAVLLGFYQRFIEALKNINGRLIRELCAPLRHGFDAASRTRAGIAAKNADLPWLFNLFAGIAVAFVFASFIIPALMERFPQTMRGLFFGLVLGSVITPWRDIRKFGVRHAMCAAAAAAVCFILLGQQFSPPAAFETVVADGNMSLSQMCASAPCLYPASDILALEQNSGLAAAVSSPDDVIVRGTAVTLETPYALFCVLAGFCGICAMLMPGISGSFILLAMGCYYFMLNTGKSFLRALAGGTFLAGNLLYLGCFVLGAVLGVAVFSRILSWLLKNCRDMTLSAIIGILIGCLRAIWPFKAMQDGSPVNFIPQALSWDLVWPAAACISGLAIVALTLRLQNRVSGTVENSKNSDGCA